MKKRFLLIIPIIVVLLIGINVHAKMYTNEKISNSTYIIGYHMFTRNKNEVYNGVLTMEWIMYASRSIDSDNVDDMIIYYKNAKGKWKNPINNSDIEFPEDGVEIFYIDGINSVIPIPSLQRTNSNSLNAKFVISNTDDYCYGNCAESTDAYKVDGYEFYEYDDDTGDFVKKGESIEGENPLTHEFVGSVEPNDNKMYAVRLYKIEDGERDYSEYAIIYIEGYIKAPTLVLDWSSEDDPNGYNRVAYDVEENRWYAKVHLNNHGVRPDDLVEIDNIYNEYNSQDPNDYSADGYDVFETGSEVLVGSAQSVNDTAKVYGTIGTEANYHARAFKYDSNNNKVYSGFSFDVYIRFDNTLHSPEIVVDREGVDSYFDYNVGIDYMDYCIAHCDDNDETNNIYSINNFAVYFKNGSDNTYRKLGPSVPVTGNPLLSRLYTLEPNLVGKLVVEVYQSLPNDQINSVMSATEYDIDTSLPSPKLNLDGAITCDGDDQNSLCKFNLKVPITDDLIFIKDYYGEGNHLLKVEYAKVYDRNGNVVRFNRVDPNTGEQLYDPESGEPLMDSIIKIGESRTVSNVLMGTEAYYYARAYYEIDGEYVREYYSRAINENDYGYIEMFSVTPTG